MLQARRQKITAAQWLLIISSRTLYLKCVSVLSVYTEKKNVIYMKSHDVIKVLYNAVCMQ